MDLEQFTKKKSLTLNSIWNKLEKTGFKFYCVSCHKERHLTTPSRPGSIQFYTQVTIATAFLMMLIWPWCHFKGIVIGVPVLMIFEAVHRLKMRGILVCPDCSFDPILYMVDREKAVLQVEAVWRKKFEERGFPFPEPKRARRVGQAAATKPAVVNVGATVNEAGGVAVPTAVAQAAPVVGAKKVEDAVATDTASAQKTSVQSASIQKPVSQQVGAGLDSVGSSVSP